MQKLAPILLLLLANASLVECKNTSVRLQKRLSQTVQKKKKSPNLTKEQERSKKEKQRIFGYIVLVVFSFTAIYVIIEACSSMDTNGDQSNLPITEEPRVLKNFNPYKEPNPYEVFPIDWNKSTLDPKAIEDLKKDKPNISIHKEHGRRIWPAFVVAKMLNTQIYTKDEWIRIFYNSSSLAEDKLLNELKRSLDEPYYFHATKTIKSALDILSSEEISITGKSHPGAFVSPKNPVGHYGKFIFSFTRNIEFFTLPLSYNDDWVGFWKPIPLKKYLCEIFIDTNHTNQPMSDKEFATHKNKIEAALQLKGYGSDIKVSRLSSLNERRQKIDPSRYRNGKVVPIWFRLGSHFTFQRNNKNELEGHGLVDSKRWKKGFRELYSDKKLEVKMFQKAS